MLDLLSLIWGFGESCTIVHIIASLHNQPMYPKMLYGHFRQHPTGWLKLESGTFRRPVWDVRGEVGLGDGPIW